MANSQNLEDMKLPELKELAKQMGLRGTSTMRKPELLATLQAARSGGEPPAGVTVRTPKADKAVTKAAKAEPVVEETAALAEPQLDLSALAEEPKAAEPRRVRRKAADEATEEPRDARHRRDDERTGRKPRQQADEAGDLLASLDLGETTASERRRNRRDDTEAPLIRRVHDEDQPRRRRRPADSSDETVRDLDDILATLPTQKHDEPSDDGEQSEDREFSRRSRNRDRDRDNRNDRNDRRNRRMRGRDRGENAGEDDRRFDDRENRNDRREEPQEDLVPVAGIVDVLDSYAFVRTSGYLPGPNDVYVSMGQVKKYGLRKGDAVHGSIRAPRENDRRNQRQKFVPLQSIDSINGQSVEDALNRPQFSKLTPLYPQERLKQETAPNKLTGRIMDIVSPIGKGQRGLIVSPPKAGKTITLQNIANAIAANNPEVHLMVVLVDERPEEVTDMERTVQGEVISSTFDRPASDHTTVAELAIERAKRLVELGQDVVVLLDSMTRLARAYNIAAPASGRILSGGVDAQALYPPKKFFGAARNIENGGSLTIISSALVETGSKMDEVIFEEFKGTGNMELRLSRELADKRLFPAIDINASGTRREELITDPQELPIIYRLRRLLGGMEPEQAYQTLVPRLKKTASNRDFLAAIVQQANTGNAVNGN
ncbi:MULTISPECIES: transcription termination factor Rho [Bifidobacterium]|uniref:transcription termination factor Rho n=1 Tax=Bifidobacterium TaxID=1678 RepID=UPI001B3C673A|nr:transcription termination factor Rho [Bifidobacterium breve]MBV3120412.1 transcription termination factor Rho [Bifidobacterium longum]MBD9020629.1 transcription termination factor Rho [Bifidobacterium breve]MCI2118229.1 transcription termination factor Rho [Bifidobacterium breve]MCI2129634.1 transcription termination factor Rho [Bifidobacterium breve]MCZ4465888.1 transcription termination factor Rho [Bifidobacterium breve]